VFAPFQDFLKIETRVLEKTTLKGDVGKQEYRTQVQGLGLNGFYFLCACAFAGLA